MLAYSVVARGLEPHSLPPKNVSLRPNKSSKTILFYVRLRKKKKLLKFKKGPLKSMGCRGA